MYYSGKEKLFGKSSDDRMTVNRLADLRDGTAELFEGYNSLQQSHIYIQLCFTAQSVIEKGNRIKPELEECDDCTVKFADYDEALDQLLSGQMPELFDSDSELTDPVQV